MELQKSNSKLSKVVRSMYPLSQRRVSWGATKKSSMSIHHEESVVGEKRSFMSSMGDTGEISHWPPAGSKMISTISLKGVASTSWSFFSCANCSVFGKKRSLAGLLKGPEVKIDTSILPIDYFSTYQGKIKPSLTALISLDGTKTFTYEELNNLSDLMAKDLKPTIEQIINSDAYKEISHASGSEPCVGIALPHSENWVIVILSIWKLGLAYFPIRIDENPVRRVAKTVDNLKPLLIIGLKSDSVLQRAVGSWCTIVPFEQLWSSIIAQKAELKVPTAWSSTEREKRLNIKALAGYRLNVDPSERCCVVLSRFDGNGEPMTTQTRNITLWNRIHAEWKAYPYFKDEYVAMFTPVDSHEFVGQMLAPLLAGQPVVTVANPDDLYKFAEQVTKWKTRRLKIYPNLLRSIITLLDIAEKGSPESKFFSSVKYWFCTGGSLRRDLAISFFRQAPRNSRLINLYGCKEALSFVCFEEFKSLGEVEHGAYYETMPIGRPVINTRIYILDEEAKITEDSGLGEVFISGLGIVMTMASHGPKSADNDESTNASTSTKLVLNPNLSEKDNPMYRCMLKTSDFGKILYSEVNKYKLCGCFLKDKPTLRFAGNGEGEVVVENYRINTNELTFHIKNLPTVKTCHVVVYRPGTQSMAILAFVVVAHRYNMTKEELHLHLRKRVPKYMMPTIVFIPGIPIKNFKINNAQLVDIYQKERMQSSNSSMKGIPSKSLENLLGFKINSPEMKAAVILFRVLFHCCGVGDEFVAAHMSWTLAELTIRSTSLPRILKELRRHGYYIDFKDFFDIKTPGDILKAMIAKKVNERQTEEINSGNQFTVEVITAKHKREIIKFFTRSNYGYEYQSSIFYIYGMSKKKVEQTIVDIWPLIVLKPYSIAVRDKRTKNVVAALLNADNTDKADSEHWKILAKRQLSKYYIELMDDIDERMKINGLTTSKTLHALFFLVDPKLDASFQDSLKVTKLLITEAMQVGKTAGFHEICIPIFDYFYSNAVADALEFDIIESKQINTFETKDGSRPFGLAPDNISGTLLHKFL